MIVKMRTPLLRTFVIWLITWPLVTAALSALKHFAPSLATPAQTLLLAALLAPFISLVFGPLVNHLIPERAPESNLTSPDDPSH